MTHIERKKKWLTDEQPFYWHVLDAIIQYNGKDIKVFNENELKWDHLEFSQDDSAFNFILKEIERDHAQFMYSLYDIECKELTCIDGYFVMFLTG